ncbi:MAG TPA: TonB-dependent siderophore receptor [Noviherbaspirillum sp.]|uniref:TonB-dependent receptor n=1 Tax=Noviherbaspirillum sp. TaxID=1926288 RepID=UPI002D7121EE|nr:TonB-dependent siderophore receptor [Noviherbaspirillum sp.]HYD95415.1 TonB-dependent siderophore receptor [Noviherbaspirillum sp.]
MNKLPARHAARARTASVFRLRPSVALTLAAVAQFALPGIAGAAEDTTLPSVTVRAAAERADGPVNGYRAERSATFTRTDTPLKEVPASLTVVPGEVMRDQAMGSIADVIRYVPGATAHQGEGNRDQVVLRGNATTADFFVDGIRDDAQTFRDLYNLERVEVLKGPAGMVFGRGGAGGVINRVTKRPVFGHVGSAQVTAGSHSQVRGAVDVGNKINDAAAWRLNAMAENADSFRDGVELKRWAINPTVTLVPGAGTVLTLGYEHLRDERTADRGFPSISGRPFNADPSTFFGNADQSLSDSTVDGFSAVLEHDLGGGVQMKNNFRATRYDKFYQNVFASSPVNAAGNLTLAAYNHGTKRTNIFNQTDVTMKTVIGGFEHTLLAGVELGHQDSTGVRMTGFFGNATTTTVSAANPFAAATRFQSAGTDANNRVKADIAGVYVQDQLALSKQWKLLAGLRYDHFKVNFDDLRTTTAPVDLSRTDNAFSPRLGLIWTPNDWSTYYASYSFAVLPSGEQLSLAANTADLAPEKARNYEIGARWDLSRALTLSAALFRLDRDDVRVADPLRAGFFVKTGQQRTEGLELGLQGDVTRNWQVFAGYAYLDGRITKATSNGPAGARIGLVPEHSLSLWNKVTLGGGWGAGLGVVYQGESYTSFTNNVKLPAFTRTDGAVYYDFADGKTRLALNVENLFDKKYYPTANGDNNISPGAPRNARLTLSTTF